jgi:integrase
MNTLSELIDRYIAEMGTEIQPGIRPLGTTQLYCLRAIQRRPIAQKVASEIKKGDIIEYAKWRRGHVGPATTNSDLGNIGVVLKYASSAWDDCENVSNAPIEAARPMLVTYGIIGKSVPRKRVPSDEEVAKLLNYYAEHPGRRLRMPDVIAFGLCSTRRRGEICRMTWGDIDWDRKDERGYPTPMYMIRDLKHPKKKKGNNRWFPLFPELAEIIKRQPRKDPNDPTERVFPFVPESVTQSYIVAKKACGIENLRLHDSRRAAITKWLAILKSPHQVKLISGHETTHILERVYDASDPAKLHASVEAMLKSVDDQLYNHSPGWRSEHG